MRAAVLEGPCEIVVRDIPDPVCGDDDIVIRVVAAGICGSDLHAYTGAFAQPGQVLGHEFSGTVVEAGRRVAGIAVGDRVTGSPAVDCEHCPRCREGNPLLCQNQAGNVIGAGLPGAFAEYLRIPRARLGRSVFHLPAGLDWVAGATAEPLGVGLHVAHLARVRPTETAVVLGLGPIGLYAVQGLRASGAGRVVGIDTQPARLALAERFGAVVHDAGAGDSVARVAALTGGGGSAYGDSAEGAAAGASADVVCECSGIPAVLGQALAMVRRGGRLVVVALYEQRAELDMNQVVVKELDLRGSFGYGSGAWAGLGEALDLLAAGTVDSHSLVSHRFALEDAAEAFRVQAARGAAVKVMLTQEGV